MDRNSNLIKDAARPVLIAGPCSAESRKQIILTAEALSGIPGLIAYRAGLWKPRTRPGDFEGVGTKGLSWLKEVKEKHGMKLAVEIAVPAHAEACLEAGVDILWIGARTVVSPFMVDDIARVLAGSDVCVMIKNPVNPDLSLWVGGIERLQNAGIRNIAVIHRGFDSFSSKPYRNLPLWEIPIELKRLFPDLPMLCDPSHIGGQRNLIPDISQKALDLGMDGLMVETHIDPDKALTDTAQQISPSVFKKMIESLVIRNIESGSANNSLENYRTSIDEIDGQLLELLSKRMEVAVMIGKIKKNQNLAPLQPERWAAVLEDRLSKASSLHLNSEFIKKVFNLIHLESIGKQE